MMEFIKRFFSTSEVCCFHSQKLKGTQTALGLVERNFKLYNGKAMNQFNKLIDIAIKILYIFKTCLENKHSMFCVNCIKSEVRKSMPTVINVSMSCICGTMCRV